jgi:hypothetical protein
MQGAFIPSRSNNTGIGCAINSLGSAILVNVEHGGDGDRDWYLMDAVAGEACLTILGINLAALLPALRGMLCARWLLAIQRG